MRMHSIARAVLFVTVILAFKLGLANNASAQVESGTISGVVLDTSGAAISGARVNVTNTATGQVRTTVANTSGEYSVPFLPPGIYDVEASEEGFGTVVQRGVTLRVDQILAVNITLKPGSLKVTLEVTAELPPLQTETATLGNVVNGQQVQTLPLNGRNFMDLASLTAGTTPAEPGSRNQAEGGFASNGNRSYDNNIMLDGVDNNSLSPDLRNGTDFMVSPPPDAIQEFNVETNGYGPEFGRGGGAAVNIAIKSGTNSFHGDVWEYLRNEKFDARNFFDTTDTKTPPYKQNQFGATIGGPIIKNHTFFFGDYQGTRIRNAETFNSVVPTLAERTGDFSDGFLGTPTDPATCNSSGMNCSPITPSDPNIDPLALKLAALYPAPNSQGNHFIYNPVLANNTDQFDIRVDHSFGQSTPVFVRVSHSRNHLNNPGQLPGLALGAPGTLQGNTMQNNSTGVAIGVTHVFSPTFVNDLRVGYARLEITQLPFFGTVNTDAQYGIPGIPFVSGLTGGLPVLTFSDSSVQQLGAEGCVPTIEITNVYTYRDVLSWTRAKHKMTMGFEGRPSEFTIFQPCNGRGNWSYSGAFTNSGFADFLLQLPSSAQLATLHNIDYKRANYGIFFGDNWHATTRLNVNAGLRWEYHSPVWERGNQQAALGFDNNYYVSGQTSSVPSSLASLFPVKQSPWGKYLNEPHRRDLAPRVGLAYQLNPATIVRASYGIFWQAEEIGTYSNPSPGFNPPYYILAVFNALSTTTVNPTVNKLSNGFPANAITSGFDPTSVFYTRLQPDFADGYVQEWNLTVQRQIGSASSIEVAYMGSKGTHLINGATGNQATATPDPNAPIAPRRPIPTLFSEVFDILSNAYANYNGLGITLRRNFSRGLSANVAYTWSHALDIASSSNLGSGNNGYYRSEANQNWEYGNADIDLRHRLTAYYDWQLPFGHGRSFAAHTPGWLDAVVGGWSHLGIWSWHTGSYFTPVLSIDYSNSGAPQERPDLTCNPNNNAPHTTAHWFNNNCFALPAQGTYGNAGRNILLGPGYFDTNLSLLKDFHITESRYLQFRAEFFNAFNHPNFTGISGSGLTVIAPTEVNIGQTPNPPNSLILSQVGQIQNAFAPRQVQFALKFYF